MRITPYTGHDLSSGAQSRRTTMRPAEPSLPNTPSTVHPSASKLPGSGSGGITPCRQILQRTLTEEKLSDIEKISRLVGENAPNIQAMARDAMKAIIKNLNGKDADPDKLFLNTFDFAQSSQTSFTGWEHIGHPISSMTLTELMMRNFGADKQDLLPEDLNVYQGVYTHGADERFYGAANEYPLSVGDLRDAIWAADLQTKVLTRLQTFWDLHGKDVELLAKVQFAVSARQAAEENSLSPAGLSLVLRGAGALRDPLLTAISGEHFDNAEAVENAQALIFDINGYPSSDIVRFVAPGQPTVLYIPGAKPSFHEFSSERQLEYWVEEQAASPDFREMLERHFSLYRLQDGFWHTGVSNGLKKLGSGDWTTGINTNSQPVGGPLFATLADNMRKRSLSDADTLIKSDNEVTRDIWIGQLQVFNRVFWPILMLVPELEATTLATTMGSELLLETNQAITGDTYEERKAGAYGAASTGGAMMLGAGLSLAAKKIPSPDIAVTAVETETPPPPAPQVHEDAPFRIGDISRHEVDPALIEGRAPNSHNIYQAKERSYIRQRDKTGETHVYEIRSDFKLRDGYVNVINPETRRSVAVLHSDGNGGWVRVPADGGGIDRPPFSGARAEEVRQFLNRRGYEVLDPHETDELYDAIQAMKERVDALRFKLEDLGREAEQDGKIGDYHIVYRVDNLTPGALLNAGKYRPSRNFFAVDNLIEAPATIGSASLAASNNVLEIWQYDLSDGPMYQYAISMEGKRVGSHLDAGETDHEFLDEVHFPPPLAENVYLLDSSDLQTRKLIGEIAKSRSVNTSYGIPLDVFEDYRLGRLELDSDLLLELPGGLSTSDGSDNSLESFDTSKHGQSKVREWLAANEAQHSPPLPPQPGPSRSRPQDIPRPSGAGRMNVRPRPAHSPSIPRDVQEWIDAYKANNGK